MNILQNQLINNFDNIEYFNKSIIQHGKYNDRVYILKLSEEDLKDMIDIIKGLVDKYNYSKVIAKIPKWAYNRFIENGFVKEAFIPSFYNGSIDCYFLCKYNSDIRKNVEISVKKKINEVLEIAESKKNQQYHIKNKYSERIKRLDEDDINNLTNLYKKVFSTYPFPIFDEKFIYKKINDDTIFYGIYYKDNLISASSLEIDYDNYNAEMTDFATLEKNRGNNLSYFLLKKMECAVKQLKIKTLYTIARSMSYGMNITFCKMNYEFGGILYNNTCISGGIENMNVYYKNKVL